MAFWHRFSVDVFNKEYISGWCYSRLQKSQTVRLELFERDRLIGSCVADIYREDLVAQKIHPTGKCGFTFFLPDTIDWEGNELLTVRVLGASQPLVDLEKEKAGQPVTAVSIKHKLTEMFTQRKPKLVHPVFFLHIPKTAGTSFNTFVQHTFSLHSITHAEVYRDESLHTMAGKYDYISGHLRIDRFCNNFPSDQYRWMTILREPFGHFHSHLNWLRGVAADQESDFYKKHNATFKHLANGLKDKRTLSPEELQTLVDSFEPAVYPILENYQTRYLVSGYRDRVQEPDTEEALANLRKFFAVGVTDRFGDFQQYFLQLNRAKMKEINSSMNKARLEPLFDHKDPVYREIIASFVHSDKRLYDEAVRRLQSAA